MTAAKQRRFVPAMTDTPLVPLAAAFDPPDESRWRALAEAALKGAPFERLTTKTPDGVVIAPLYRAPDVQTPAAPLIQAALAGRSPHLPWDIRQLHAHPDPARLNAQVLEDLSGGVSSVEILIDDGCGAGVAVGHLPAALAGVHLDIAPVAIDAGRLGSQAATALAALLAASGTDPARLAPVFNLDPLSAWLRVGGCDRPLQAELAETMAQVGTLAAAYPRASALLISAQDAHEAGASPPQELALLLAATAEYLRAGEAAGVAPDFLAAISLARLSVGPDLIVEIAKLRAARVVWASLFAACGVDTAPMRLQAVTSRRMLTRDDAWTNILRGTAACFAAATAGADVVTVVPFTEPLGLPSALARRMARNTQLILMEECRLGHVADPGGGAFAVEALTHDLAQQAWAQFQAIERQGGLIASAKAGTLQGEIAAARDARAKLVATRRQPITGVSDYPLLDETTPEIELGAGPVPKSEKPAADLITPLIWQRLSAPFEALRDAAKGKGATVFFANLGPLAEFSARANFAQNLYAAGGIGAIGPDAVYPDHTALTAAFTASGCRVAVLTGADSRYTAEGQDAARALKAAGCDWLVYAGKPSDEPALRAQGFDQFIFAGQDAIAALRLTQTALGIA